jgi:glyoxylase-like metal-dependent hydrolase (beta-lactamase superfamily II)
MKQSLDLGDIRISWLNGGEFELDGGTMFGPVPKILWNKKYPADANNNIKMLNAPLLVETTEESILIDTGLGNKLSHKEKEIFQVTKEWSVIDDLTARGMSREDISLVILTHCDFDHAGGIVMHNNQGKSELTFPNAKHLMQKKEWEDVTHTNSRSAHTYWPHNFTGLEDSGLLELIDGDYEILPGVSVSATGGHTRGHQFVVLEGKTGCAVHLGDLLPLHSHCNPLWIMAYDNFPLEIIEQKETLLPVFSSRNCWFTFYHDIYMKACQIDSKGELKSRWQD